MSFPIRRFTLIVPLLLAAGCRSKERCGFEVHSTERGCTVRGDLSLRNGSFVNLKGSFGCGEQFERCGVTRRCTCEPDASTWSFESPPD
ncbi:MAG: hypothetical protein GQE15_29375 [Archangiaceae bacterium]|nr:hypothetical protein [Archangiaceae bacterium]